MSTFKKGRRYSNLDSEFKQSNPNCKQTKYLIIKDNKNIDVETFSAESKNKRQIKSSSQLHKINERGIEPHFASKSMFVEKNTNLQNQYSSLDNQVSVGAEAMPK